MTKEEDSARLITAIRERVPLLECPICHTKEFILGEDLVPLPLAPFHAPPGMVRMTGRSSPSVILICQHCGNTVLLNLVVLGLQDMLNSPAPQVVPISASIEAHVGMAADVVRTEDKAAGRKAQTTDELHISDQA